MALKYACVVSALLLAAAGSASASAPFHDVVAAVKIHVVDWDVRPSVRWDEALAREGSTFVVESKDKSAAQRFAASLHLEHMSACKVDLDDPGLLPIRIVIDFDLLDGSKTTLISDGKTLYSSDYASCYLIGEQMRWRFDLLGNAAGLY